jgi:hypothetical protein
MSRTIRVGAAALAVVAVGAIGVITDRAEGDLHLHRVERTMLVDGHLEHPAATTPTVPATPQAPKG